MKGNLCQKIVCHVNTTKVMRFSINPISSKMTPVILRAHIQQIKLNLLLFYLPYFHTLLHGLNRDLRFFCLFFLMLEVFLSSFPQIKAQVPAQPDKGCPLSRPSGDCRPYHVFCTSKCCRFTAEYSSSERLHPNGIIYLHQPP